MIHPGCYFRVMFWEYRCLYGNRLNNKSICQIPDTKFIEFITYINYIVES
jgi:hypothetical protein